MSVRASPLRGRFKDGCGKIATTSREQMKCAKVRHATLRSRPTPQGAASDNSKSGSKMVAEKGSWTFQPLGWARFAGLSLACAIASWPTPAKAIVNTQPLFRDVTTQAPYAFTARAGVDLQRGNTRLLVFDAAVAARAKWGDHELLLSGAHTRSSASGTELGNRSFGHLRYRYWVEGRFQWEVYGQIAQDRFQLLAFRGVGGTGPRFMAFKSTTLEWTLGLSYMYEVEQVEDSIDYPDGLTRKAHRANLSHRIRLDYKALTLQQVIYLQPSFLNLTNYRVLHELDCALEVFEHFSLTWTLSQSRDSIAPSDVVPFDNRLLAGVKADF